MTYTTNKWVGIAVQATDQLTPDMLAYLQANQWGLWLEFDLRVSAATVKTAFDPVLATIQNNYTIPVMINLASISDNWGWGNAPAEPASYYESQFGAILDYFESWANGTNGNCLIGYWYEAGWPNMASWLRNRTKLRVGWAVSWLWYTQSTCGKDVCNNPDGGIDWITGNKADMVMTIAQRIALVDELYIEVWCMDDLPIAQNFIAYLKSCFPNKSIGLDSMVQGGHNIDLWGSTYGHTPYDGPATYALQRQVFKTNIQALLPALSRGKFDCLVAEVNGDSDGSVQNGSELQIVSDQLSFFTSCNLINGGNIVTTTINASTSGINSVTVNAAAVNSTLTIVTPATAIVGIAFNITGKLTRNDTSAGVASQTIQLLRNGAASTTATTASDGTYSMSVIEAAAGTDTYQVSFAGASV